MHEPRERSWWDRNWQWFLPAGCLSGVLLVLGFVAGALYLVFGMMKSSDACRQAFARAQRSPAVVESLGEPLREGLCVAGNIHVNGLSGSAELSLPVSGPKGKGTVFLKATKSMGEWTFDELAVRIERTGRRIDLLAE